MKFPGFKEFDNFGMSIDSVLKYLRIEHTGNLKELVTGLGRLAFLDNFQCFRVTVEIPAGAEVGIENKLRDSIPSDRIITRSNVSDITDGDTAWTATHVYLRNNSGSDATLTVIFFK